MEKRTKRILHVSLRLIFGICLFLSQFISSRNTFFTENYLLLSTGILFILCSILIMIAASKHLHNAVNGKKIATDGPYKYIRHPIYTSIYILTAGLGLIFFAWSWFIVMIVFMPLWYLECREEEKEMIKLHGNEYIDYQEKTRMFFPKFMSHIDNK